MSQIAAAGGDYLVADPSKAPGGLEILGHVELGPDFVSDLKFLATFVKEADLALAKFEDIFPHSLDEVMEQVGNGEFEAQLRAHVVEYKVSGWGERKL